MEQHRIEVLLEAEQPIAHLAESFGNVGILNTRPIRQHDGSIARVPEISGDAMRHGLREAGAYVFLDAAGMLDSPALGEAALRLMFAGGMVTGKGDAGAVRLGEYRKMVDLVPMLALLGGCAENRTIPGRLCVDPATLVCEESARFLPEWIARHPIAGLHTDETWRGSVEEVQRVRMDPSLDPGKRALLESGAVAQIEARLDRSEKASREDDAVSAQANKSTMLPRRYERVIQGALFSWSVTVTLFSPLDTDTFYTALLGFMGNMIVGGKRATGHGKMRVVQATRTVLARAREIPKPEDMSLTTLSPQIGNVFLAHVEERAAKIREYLATVNA
jgi:hypothetical protein